MNLSKRKTSAELTDKVAVKLANLIMKMQFRCSIWLNRRFNSYSIREKKKLTITIGLLIAILLIAGSFCPFYLMPKLSQNYTSAHIGLPSELPKPQFIRRQLTDSLTNKK